jgi:hypothetical protein
MGCDIHIYSESLIEGKWVCQERIVDVNAGYSQFPEPHYDTVDEDDLFLGRNYFLFGILAGVRSWDEPDFDVKGFPEDASEEIQILFRQWDNNCHTPSYISLSELEEWLDREQYEGRKEVLESNIKHWIEELKKVNVGNVISSMSGFLKGKYMDEEYEYVNSVIQGWVDKLSKREGEDQRIVFWFDS